MAVIPDLIIEINVSCPNCSNYFDLLVETNLNDEGELLAMALPDGAWVDEHEKFECEVVCPNCKTKFSCKGLNW